MPIAVAASRISDAARYSAGPGLSFCGRSSWRQRCEHGGGEKQRRDVAQQVAVLLRIRQRLLELGSEFVETHGAPQWISNGSAAAKLPLR